LRSAPAPPRTIEDRDLNGLLVEAQQRLEALYAVEPQAPVTEFLIDEQAAGHYPGGGSRTLVTQQGDELALGVVLTGEVMDALRRDDPRQGLHRHNLGPFCTLVEEVSHFVFLLFCAGNARSVTQLELELQGEVDKYLSVVCLLALQNEGAVSGRLKELLFREYQLVEHLSAERAERYHAASALAYRYCTFLEVEYLRRARLADLRREARRFYRLDQAGKLARIASAARA
jgi:hypothetical protein